MKLSRKILYPYFLTKHYDIMKSVSFDEIKRRLFATKIFSIIRICLLLLICSVMRAFASIGYSQLTTLSLDLKNVSVEEVLNEIESKTGYRFL